MLNVLRQIQVFMLLDLDFFMDMPSEPFDSQVHFFMFNVQPNQIRSFFISPNFV